VLGGSAALSWIDLEYPERRGSFKPGPGVQSPYSVSPDGRSLAYYAMDPVTGFDLWTVDVTKGETGLEAGVPQRWRGSAAFEVAPSYSPDGRWIAYASNASGTFEVYVSQVSGGEPFRVSVGGGSMPRWASPKGEVIYRTNDRAMIAPYRITGHRFIVGTLRRWPAPALADTGVLPNFDVSPDGARLAALVPAGRPEDQQSRDHVTVLFNLFEEVQRRLANASKQ